jgi:hypothetical protein
MDDWNVYFDGHPSKGAWRTSWRGSQMSMQLDVLGLGTLVIHMGSSLKDPRGRMIPEGLRLLRFGQLDE